MRQGRGKEKERGEEREEERDEMMVRRRLTKEENKLVVRCFYQSSPTRRVY